MSFSYKKKYDSNRELGNEEGFAKTPSPTVSSRNEGRMEPPPAPRKLNFGETPQPKMGSPPSYSESDFIKVSKVHSKNYFQPPNPKHCDGHYTPPPYMPDLPGPPPPSPRDPLFAPSNIKNDPLSEETLSDLFLSEREYRYSAYARKSCHDSSKKKKRNNPKKRKKRTMHPNMDFGFNPIPKLHQISEQLPSPSGMFDSSLKDIILQIGDCIPDCSDNESKRAFLSALENIGIFAYQLHNSNSYADMLVAIMGYMKMNTTESIIATVIEKIDGFIKHVDELEPNVDFDDVLNYWELAKVNPQFKRISYLISAAMSLSVCSIKKWEWSPFGFEFLCIEALEGQFKASTFVDALLHTFKWFWDTGSQVIKTQSLVPLFYADPKLKIIHDECDYVLAHYSSVCAGNGEDPGSFCGKVESAIRGICQLKAVNPKGASAMWLQTRYEKLVQALQEVKARLGSSKMRKAPFGITITGSSGVGKSCLAPITMGHCLNAILGDEYDPNKVRNLDLEDKHQNTYTTDTQGLYLDDVGNGKAQFSQVSPTNMIIKFFNNMAAQAIKAELNAKGVCYINFQCGIVTSNFEDINCRAYTEKPEAILRRFIHVRPTVKKEFRKPGGISLDPAKIPPVLYPDCWWIDILECTVYQSGGKDTYKFQVADYVNSKGRLSKCKHLNMKQYLDALTYFSINHSNNQDRVVQSFELYNDISYCKECKRPDPLCECPKKNEEENESDLKPNMFENIFTEIAYNAVSNVVANKIKKAISPYTFWSLVFAHTPIRQIATRQLACLIDNWYSSSIRTFLDYCMPECIRFFFDSYASYTSANFNMIIWFKRIIVISILGLCYCCVYRDIKSFCLLLVLTTISSLYCWFHYARRMRLIKEEYIRRRDALSIRNLNPLSYTDISPRVLTVAPVIAISAGVIIIGMKMLGQYLNKSLDTNTSDSNPGWFGFVMHKVGVKSNVPKVCKTATTGQIANSVKKSVFWADFVRPDGKKGSNNIVFLKKGIALFPFHCFYPNGNMNSTKVDYLNVKVFRHTGPGGVFSFKVDSSNSVRMDNLDAVLCTVPNSPDLPNFYKWLPNEPLSGSGLAKLVGRRQDDMFEEPLHVTYEKGGHRYVKGMVGGSYRHQTDYRGLCMAPVISESKPPCICGFHIASDYHENGFMFSVSQSLYTKTLKNLTELPGVLVCTDSEMMPNMSYGLPIVVGEVHPKAAFSSMDSDSYVDVLGSCRLRAQCRSKVIPTMISDSVEKVTGIPNSWGAPKMIPNWQKYNATLEHIVNPTDCFIPSELERARQDYLSDVIPCVEEYIEHTPIAPLTDVQSIIGVHGDELQKPLKMSTSMGFPMFGAKEKYFTDVYDKNSILCDRIPIDEIVEERDRLLECWKKGERAWPIVSACLKDEPTKLDSEKVRVFMVAPVALSICIRKYFLPLVSFMGNNPLITEQAVGLNSFGKGWDELMSHAEKYAEDDLMVGWDYSKFDTRMNSQITTAAWLVLIDIAKAAGYSEEDLTIMRNMVTDIVHPCCDYNGTIILLYCMNTSGNNLTVQINGIVNSLYTRLAFFHIYPHILSFRLCVAIMTYGDDLVGSVHRSFRNFNFASVKKFLATYGIKITLPDKSDDIQNFIHKSNIDFLKRKSMYIPEIKTRIGQLSEDSIFKSLHAHIASSAVTEKEQIASALTSNLHEWFAHGRQVYEARRAQMLEICKIHDIEVNAVSTTFDQRVEHWLEQYD